MCHCYQETYNLPYAGNAVSLENKGLALTWSAVRFAYAMGGDGQADMRIDIRRIAAFVRDPAACVTCLLLPLSCSAHLQISVSCNHFSVVTFPLGGCAFGCAWSCGYHTLFCFKYLAYKHSLSFHEHGWKHLQQVCR